MMSSIFECFNKSEELLLSNCFLRRTTRDWSLWNEETEKPKRSSTNSGDSLSGKAENFSWKEKERGNCSASLISDHLLPFRKKLVNLLVNLVFLLKFFNTFTAKAKPFEELLGSFSARKRIVIRFWDWLRTLEVSMAISRYLHSTLRKYSVQIFLQ